jgi:acetolactate synthase-1/2/3 large subunit
MAPEWTPTSDGVNFAAVVCEIGKHLAPNAAVTSDAGNFSSFIHRYIGFKPGQAFLSSVVGAMGAGVPMAVAACLRDRSRQVVSFSGDGGTLMTGNELATARMYGVNPILIVSDNKSYGTISMHHVVRYPGRPYAAATDLRNPDFAAWARAFGAEGITINSDEEVGPKIAAAFAVKDRPVVVHVHSSAEQMSAWRRKTQ